MSQHLKVLREAGLLVGEKKGYFMHYDVNRNVLRELAREIDTLTEIKREACSPKQGGCQSKEAEKCHSQDMGVCSDEVKEFCHEHNYNNETHRAHCKCHHS